MAATIQTIQKPTRARALDTSGNNNHGQIYSGRALEFDGVSDYLTIPDVTTGLTSCTIAIWYKKTVGNTGALIAYNSGGSYIRFTTATNLQVYVPTSGDNFDYGATITGDGSWNRAVITVTASTAKTYVNGTLLATATESAGTLFNEALTRIGSYAGGDLFDGKMTDVQIWDSAFSADDVTYDYLNPEQLALNRGGTSLTNSNLKLWYPMQDGHRGQQSFILDGSNLGVGSEVLANGDMSSATGWTAASGWSISGGIATFDGGGGSSLYRSFGASTGDVFKITYDITSYTSGGFRTVYDTQNGTTQSAVGSYTEYASYLGGNTNLFLQSVGTSELSIDNVSVKQVQGNAGELK